MRATGDRGRARVKPGGRGSRRAAILLTLLPLCGITSARPAPHPRPPVLFALHPSLLTFRPSQPPPSPFSVRVVEMARTVDLARGNREWLVATVEIAARARGGEAALRQVQPLREHFTLTDEAGQRYDCAWLKGGTSVENPAALRFQVGFPMPAPAARKVNLSVLLPERAEPEKVEVVFKSNALSRLPAKAAQPGRTVTLTQAQERDYVPPALPNGGRFSIKELPVDFRLFQRPLRSGDKAPERALLVDWTSPSAALFDRALDIDARITGVDGRPYALLGALLERHPARAAKWVTDPPEIRAHYWFRTPPKALLNGLTLTFTLRADEKSHIRTTIQDLPVPGRG